MLSAAAAGGLATSAYAAEVTEKDVTVKTPDGAADAALFYPAGKGPWPAVLIWCDFLSLRPVFRDCLLYTSPSPRDKRQSRMPSSA